MTKTVGDRIKILREARDLRQEELAQMVGMNREVLSTIENNYRQVKAEELSSFADVLQVTSDQLLGRVPFDTIHLEKSTRKQTISTGMRISIPAKRVDKFREVLLYILNKVGAKPNVGETVLYKLLYFIDFDFYEKYEEQLIGATYKKNEFGPTPTEFFSIVKDMIEKKEIEKITSKYFFKNQKKYLPLRNAELSILSAHELQLIDEVIDRLSDKTAKQISEYSHGDVPWQVTEDQEVIDYETVFYRTPPYSVRNSQDELEIRKN